MAVDAIGSMRQRVQFVSPSIVYDDFGGEVNTWADEGTYWAFVDFKKIRSEEEIIAIRPTATVYAEVTLRYNAAINPKWRMVYEGAYWEIITAYHDSHKVYSILEVEQIQPET